jgi:hypothetical protein
MSTPPTINTAREAYWYAATCIRGRVPEYESLIATDPQFAYYYAKYVIKGRWLEGELQIMFSEYVTWYAEFCGFDHMMV